MPTRDKAIIGAPCWVDLMTSDVEASRRFYSALFDWSANEPSPEFGGYFMFSKNDRPVAGGMPRTEAMNDAMPDAWSIYLATSNAEATVEAAKANGGQVIAGPMTVADLGVMSVLIDAGGAAIGLWQPIGFEGCSTFNEDGTPGWFQLNARNYDASLDFYAKTLDWNYHVLGDGPDFRYAALKIGDSTYAGIMDANGFLPEGVPPHWVVYFWVDDTDVTVRRAVELGATVTMPAQDTPYGRLASLVDPTGAHFNVMAANDQMPAQR
jgi:predicted enzyme related to lactoylglutathione lyase